LIYSAADSHEVVVFPQLSEMFLFVFSNHDCITDNYATSYEMLLPI